MPGLIDGLELARIVHERWPEIRLLLTSGDHPLPEIIIPGQGQFVGKPWSADAFISTVQWTLANPD